CSLSKPGIGNGEPGIGNRQSWPIPDSRFPIPATKRRFNMRPVLLMAAALLALPVLARAQDPAPAQPAPAPAPAPAMVRPGMSLNDVVSAWGEPAITKRNGDWTFLFYRNYNERHVGWLDVVFLQNGQVVDCIARGENHVYAGQSS